MPYTMKLTRRSLSVLLALGLLARPGAAETIRILTYNVGLLKVLGTDHVPLTETRAGLAPGEIARVVQDASPDVLLLQEVWRPAHAAAIKGALDSLGYTTMRPVSRGLLLSSGLLLAVRPPFEVVDWQFHRFTRSTFFESLASKGVLEASIALPGGGRFVVLGTHMVALDTERGEARDRGQLNAWQAQAAQILAALERRTEGGALPAVILGDFNVGPGYVDGAYRRLADAPGVVEAALRVVAEKDLVTWDPENPLVKYGRFPGEPPSKIDHILLRPGGGLSWRPVSASRTFLETVEGVRVGPAGARVTGPLSDHYGLLVAAELAPAP
jgi:endonuclease/exonuclease/phosphatase family metal-dependent hydrolase